MLEGNLITRKLPTGRKEGKGDSVQIVGEGGKSSDECHARNGAKRTEGKGERERGG